MRNRNGALKERPGIQVAMGEKVEHLAMQFVGSGTKHEVRKPGSGAAILGVERVGHDAELADTFHSGRTFANAAGPSRYTARESVHVNLGVPDTRTVDPDILNALASDARQKVDQILDVALIPGRNQRDLIDEFRRQSGADCRCRSVQQRCFGIDFHVLRSAPQRQRDIRAHTRL